MNKFIKSKPEMVKLSSSLKDYLFQDLTDIIFSYYQNTEFDYCVWEMMVRFLNYSKTNLFKKTHNFYHFSNHTPSLYHPLWTSLLHDTMIITINKYGKFLERHWEYSLSEIIKIRYGKNLIYLDYAKLQFLEEYYKHFPNKS